MVPQFTGYAQVFAAASESIGLGRLTRLPVAEVGLAVECVLSGGLGYEPPGLVTVFCKYGNCTGYPFYRRGD